MLPFQQQLRYRPVAPVMRLLQASRETTTAAQHPTIAQNLNPKNLPGHLATAAFAD
jgi:hypothetical protein